MEGEEAGLYFLDDSCKNLMAEVGVQPQFFFFGIKKE